MSLRECLSEVPDDTGDMADMANNGHGNVVSSTHHQLDQRALSGYLKRVSILPPSCSIERIVKFSHGQSNPTFLIQLTPRSGPDALVEWVLRKKPGGKILPSAHAIEREYRVLVRIFFVAGSSCLPQWAPVLAHC